MSLKIGIDATAIPANRAGAGIYIFNLVQALAQVDHSNYYSVFAKPDHVKEFGVEQSNIRFFTDVPESTSRRLLWEQTVLPAQVQRLKLDVLHSPHYTTPLHKSCRSVVTFHDMIFQIMPEVHGRMRRGFFQFMMRRSARYSEKLVAVSESTRQDIMRFLHVPPERVVAVSEAASPAFRRYTASETRATCDDYGLCAGKYIYFVGVLEPRKNVPVLLEAFSSLAAEFPNIPLVIAGKKGWMYDAIFRQSRSLGLEDRTRFLGYVPEDDLVGLYNGARVFVYPSKYEGFGLPVLEAMQCGTPVITSNVSSMPEVAGGAALLVAPNDVAGLAGAIKRVLTDDTFAEDLSRRGLQRAKQFSWQRCARETLAVYQSAMRKSVPA